MKRAGFLVIAVLLIAGIASGQARKVSASMVRPAAVDAYAAGDVVNDSSGTFRPMKFSNVVAFAGTSGRIVNGFLSMDSINVANGTFRLYVVNDTTLTDTTGIQIPADNAALTLLTAWRNNIAGYIDFTLVTAGAGSTMAIAFTTPTQPIYFQTGRSTNIYGILTATGAYVPARYGNVKVVLTIE